MLENRTKGMLAVIDRYFRHRLAELSHVSLGGGLYGHMPNDLKAQFPVEIPDFVEYAEVAALPFAKYFERLQINKSPTLIIEPGTLTGSTPTLIPIQTISTNRMLTQ